MTFRPEVSEVTWLQLREVSPTMKGSNIPCKGVLPCSKIQCGRRDQPVRAPICSNRRNHCGILRAQDGVSRTPRRIACLETLCRRYSIRAPWDRELRWLAGPIDRPISPWMRVAWRPIWRLEPGQRSWAWGRVEMAGSISWAFLVLKKREFSCINDRYSKKQFSVHLADI